jgi:carbon monoxide dehydrogenase subunit G
MISLSQQFRVQLPVDDTWNLLTDLPRVARCMPGANLDEVVDGEYRGGLATKIGPISAKYRGVAVFRERDDVEHRAVIEARGREEKGSGSATALITTLLKADGEGTLVDVSTELAISGRAAQFGRSLLAEVSNSLVDEFVRRLEAMIAGDDQSSGGAQGTSGLADAAPATGQASHPVSASDADQPLDVVSTVILPMLRRSAVPIGAAVVAGALGVLVGRRGRRPSGPSIPFTYVLPFPGSAELADFLR